MKQRHRLTVRKHMCRIARGTNSRFRGTKESEDEIDPGEKAAQKISKTVYDYQKSPTTPSTKLELFVKIQKLLTDITADEKVPLDFKTTFLRMLATSIERTRAQIQRAQSMQGYSWAADMSRESSAAQTSRLFRMTFESRSLEDVPTQSPCPVTQPARHLEQLCDHGLMDVTKTLPDILLEVVELPPSTQRDFLSSLAAIMRARVESTTPEDVPSYYTTTHDVISSYILEFGRVVIRTYGQPQIICRFCLSPIAGSGCDQCDLCCESAQQLFVVSKAWSSTAKNLKDIKWDDKVMMQIMDKIRDKLMQKFTVAFDTVDEEWRTECRRTVLLVENMNFERLKEGSESVDEDSQDAEEKTGSQDSPAAVSLGNFGGKGLERKAQQVEPGKLHDEVELEDTKSISERSALFGTVHIKLSDSNEFEGSYMTQNAEFVDLMTKMSFICSANNWLDENGQKVPPQLLEKLKKGYGYRDGNWFDKEGRKLIFGSPEKMKANGFTYRAGKWYDSENHEVLSEAYEQLKLKGYTLKDGKYVDGENREILLERIENLLARGYKCRNGKLYNKNNEEVISDQYERMKAKGYNYKYGKWLNSNGLEVVFASEKDILAKGYKSQGGLWYDRRGVLVVVDHSNEEASLERITRDPVIQRHVNKYDEASGKFIEKGASLVGETSGEKAGVTKSSTTNEPLHDSRLKISRTEFEKDEKQEQATTAAVMVDVTNKPQKTGSASSKTSERKEKPRLSGVGSKPKDEKGGRAGLLKDRVKTGSAKTIGKSRKGGTDVVDDLESRTSLKHVVIKSDAAKDLASSRAGKSAAGKGKVLSTVTEDEGTTKGGRTPRASMAQMADSKSKAGRGAVDKPPSLSPINNAISYRLSDETYIDLGWTVIPAATLLRNVVTYRAVPSKARCFRFHTRDEAETRFYPSGKKFAVINSDGTGRVYYPNGRVAISVSRPTGAPAGRRVVVMTPGGRDSSGVYRRPAPVALFDALGNGAVYDDDGRLRLNYTQREGMWRDVTPPVRWKWPALAGHEDPHEEEIVRCNVTAQSPILQPNSKGEDGTAKSRGSKDAGRSHYVASRRGTDLSTRLGATREKITAGASPPDLVETPVVKSVESPTNTVIEALRAETIAKNPCATVHPIVIKINDFIAFRLMDQYSINLQFNAESRFLRMELGVVVDRSVQERVDQVEQAIWFGDPLPCPFETFLSPTPSMQKLTRRLNDVREDARRREITSTKFRRNVNLGAA